MNGLGLANPRMWSWLAIAAIGAWLVWLLSPILAPFLAGAIIAYVLNPLVNRLEPRIGRTASVIIVMLLALVVVIGLMLVVLPLFYREARMMVDRLPDFLTWLNNNIAPLMQTHLGMAIVFDLESAKQFLTQLVQTNRGLVQQLLGSLQIGGLALLGFLINLLLVPVVLFYLLRDWNDLLARIGRVLPRGRRAQILTIAGEIDAVDCAGLVDIGGAGIARSTWFTTVRDVVGIRVDEIARADLSVVDEGIVVAVGGPFDKRLAVARTMIGTTINPTQSVGGDGRCDQKIAVTVRLTVWSP